MEAWKRNLIIVWLSQFFSILGFGAVLPFLPFYIQELGITEPVKIKYWTAVIAAASSFSLAIMAPIWGAMADRHGRRMMLLRANLGGVLCLAFGGLVPNVQWLLVMRLIQGGLTGTVSAAQTLVSVHTPVNRTGLAMGVLSSAVFTGNTAGCVLGGMLAERYGYRPVFFISAAVLFVASFLVLGVKEDFAAPAEVKVSKRQSKVRLGRTLAAAPLLGLIGVMAFTRTFDTAMFPLFVQEVKGQLKGAALWTGYMNAVGSVALLLAGVCLGWLADRISPARIGKLSALTAGLLLIPHAMVSTLLQMLGLRFLINFSSGGLDPVFQIWLAKATPPKYRGILFGWALTAKSAGWTLAPLISAAAAAHLGLRQMYLISAVMFLLLVPMISMVVRRMGLEPAPATPAATGQNQETPPDTSPQTQARPD